MSRHLFALFVVVLVGPAAVGEDPKLPGPKIDFPEVKGFTRDKDAKTFGKPELGYSVGYKAPGITVTVYVYNLGVKEIPAGAKSDAVKEQMKSAVADIYTLKERGLYKSVKELSKDEVVPLGKGKDAPTALRRQFELGRDDGTRLSDAYLTGYKDHFVKIRISYDPEGKEEAEKKIAALLEGIGSALK